METIYSDPVELSIISHSHSKDNIGLYPNSQWRWIDCPIEGDQRYSYDSRFASLFPEDLGVTGINQWVESFRLQNQRDPVVMEFMGPQTLLNNLKVPGIYVNWDADRQDGLSLEESPYGSIVGINCDIENLPLFYKFVSQALDQFGGGNCLDKVIWKAEGGLVFLDPFPESFCYWFDKLTSMLSPGGVALIQGMSNFQSELGIESLRPDIYAEKAQAKGNGRIIYREFPEFYIYDTTFCMYIENYFGGPMGVFY